MSYHFIKDSVQKFYSIVKCFRKATFAEENFAANISKDLILLPTSYQPIALVNKQTLLIQETFNYKPIY